MLRFKHLDENLYAIMNDETVLATSDNPQEMLDIFYDTITLLEEKGN
jgi:hypothetical protein